MSTDNRDNHLFGYMPSTGHANCICGWSSPADDRSEASAAWKAHLLAVAPTQTLVSLEPAVEPPTQLGAKAAARIATVAELAAALLVAHPDWRPGQSAFNALERIEPECADVVRHMLFDPFYRDDQLPEFWTFVGEWIGSRP